MSSPSVEPTQGMIDDEGWAFYRDVVSAIAQAGMEPMPTLDHFVYPEWVFHQGGWLNPSTGSGTLLWAYCEGQTGPRIELVSRGHGTVHRTLVSLPPLRRRMTAASFRWVGGSHHSLLGSVGHACYRGSMTVFRHDYDLLTGMHAASTVGFVVRGHH